MWRLIGRIPKAQGMLATLKRPRVGRPVVVPGAIARGDMAIRAFRVTVPAYHGPSHRGPDAKYVHLHWVNKKTGEVTVTDAAVGDSLLQTAHHHGIELEGACEGVCACSTCHVILEEDVFDRLEPASEEEEDMLDQAFAITPTSRLGCQVVVDESMEGMKIKLPAATRNMYVDGHVPKPH